MSSPLSGIHHITAIAADPQQNIDFYVGFLGLRLVKRTVNFDAPEVYHFYYGDEVGSPGTMLTFFPFPQARRGTPGTGAAQGVAFSIPSNSLDYWMERLATRAIPFEGPRQRFGSTVISFEDPDGMLLELVTHPAADEFPAWSGGTVDRAHATRGFSGVTLSESALGPTAGLLTGLFGFRPGGVEGHRHRFHLGTGMSEANVDVVVASTPVRARQSAGSVHHIAWRVPDDETQVSWQRRIEESGYHVTPVQDRKYFRSIYFREPGGVLFEIATDLPGATVDESRDELGTTLKLPGWLESRRRGLEEILPPIEVPIASPVS